MDAVSRCLPFVFAVRDDRQFHWRVQGTLPSWASSGAVLRAQQSQTFETFERHSPPQAFAEPQACLPLCFNACLNTWLACACVLSLCTGSICNNTCCVEACGRSRCHWFCFHYSSPAILVRDICF